MRITLFSIALGSLFVAAVARAGAPEVVVTAFGPYGNEKTNPSLAIGRALAKHLEENGVATRFCELPVVFGGAFASARRCLEGADAVGAAPEEAPRFIFSLGSGSECAVARLETVAANERDGDLADNAGIKFKKKRIDDGPSEIPLPYDPMTMLSGLSPAERAWFELHDDMARYVCNDLGYEMSRYLEKSPRYARTSFAFLHVPTSRCHRNYRDSELWSPLVTKMILAALGEPARTPLAPRFRGAPPPKKIPLAERAPGISGGPVLGTAEPRSLIDGD